MKNLAVLSTILNQLAPNNVLGDPRGIPAAAYIRVSSEEQAKEGRDGLPRQIQHISEIAAQKGYRIDLADVYADDDSGFEYEYRFALNRLRRDYLQGRFNAVVMEHLDRLSRTGWHQGLLLHEMKTKAKVAPLFWKEFSSEIERAVMGAISEQGMQQAKERMKSGLRGKAKSGRVTTKVAAFGYRLVDQNGNETSESRRNTYYGIHEAEAAIVRSIYEMFAYGGYPLRALARHVKELDSTRRWDMITVRRVLTSRIYKGEYIHGRVEVVRTPKYDRDNNYIGMHVSHRERPEEEWILVPVPRIVSDKVWDDAQRAMKQNQATASRNSKREYLLTGLTKCAHCGRAYIVGSRGSMAQKSGDRGDQYYRCSREEHKKLNCPQRGITVRKLEAAVWNAVLSIILDTSLVSESLDRKLNSDSNDQLMSDIGYIKKRLEELPERDLKAKRAYNADIYTLDEFSAERKLIKQQQHELETQLQALEKKLVTPEHVAEQKQFLMAVCEKAKGMNLDGVVPFEAKRRIIRLMVDKITVDTVNGVFGLDGVINMTFGLDCVSSYPQNQTQITYRSLYTLSGTFLEMEL